MAISPQQNYLFERLPKPYNLKFKDTNEPVKIKSARELIKNYEEERSNSNRTRNNRIQAIIKEAQEAIYFQPISDALETVKKAEIEIEKLLTS
jgi:uncharacterized membrane protein